MSSVSLLMIELPAWKIAELPTCKIVGGNTNLGVDELGWSLSSDIQFSTAHGPL